MNKRANRVYWMLFIMMLILGLCFAIDGIRAEKHSADDSTISGQTMINNENNTAEAASEELTDDEDTTEEEETTEGTTIDPALGERVYESFYNGQAFVGDSIMKGFSTFASKSEAPAWLKNVVFLSKTSWGIGSALDANGPFFRGREQSVCTSLSEIKPKRVFINLGINEMNGLGSPGYSIEKLINKYSEFISKLKETIPSAELYIINITPCTAEKETAIFRNSTIKDFNTALEAKCEEWNVNYVDLASGFGDVLLPELSSDNFVHHNDKAYREIWLPCLERIAVEHTPEETIEAIEKELEASEDATGEVSEDR